MPLFCRSSAYKQNYAMHKSNNYSELLNPLLILILSTHFHDNYFKNPIEHELQFIASGSIGNPIDIPLLQ